MTRTPVVVAGLQSIIIRCVRIKTAVDSHGCGNIAADPIERSPARRRPIQFVTRRSRNRAPTERNRAVALRRRRRRRRRLRSRCRRNNRRTTRTPVVVAGLQSIIIRCVRIKTAVDSHGCGNIAADPIERSPARRRPIQFVTRRSRNRAPTERNRAVALRRRRRRRRRLRSRCRRNNRRTTRTPVVVAGLQSIIIRCVRIKTAVDSHGCGNIAADPIERSPARRRPIQFVTRRSRNRAPTERNRAVALRHRRRRRRRLRSRCRRNNRRTTRTPVVVAGLQSIIIRCVRIKTAVDSHGCGNIAADPIERSPARRRPIQFVTRRSRNRAPTERNRAVALRRRRRRRRRLRSRCRRNNRRTTRTPVVVAGLQSIIIRCVRIKTAVDSHGCGNIAADPIERSPARRRPIQFVTRRSRNRAPTERNRAVALRRRRRRRRRLRSRCRRNNRRTTRTPVVVAGLQSIIIRCVRIKTAVDSHGCGNIAADPIERSPARRRPIQFVTRRSRNRAPTERNRAVALRRRRRRRRRLRSRCRRNNRRTTRTPVVVAGLQSIIIRCVRICRRRS